LYGLFAYFFHRRAKFLNRSLFLDCALFLTVNLLQITKHHKNDMIHPQPGLPRLYHAIKAMQMLSDAQVNEADWLMRSKCILQTLINADDWLPASHAQSHPQFYQQHALHVDAEQRFSISSFVWGPGQGTPIHNHTIAGWVGVLRGAELCQRYSADGLHKLGPEMRLNAGELDAVSATNDAIGDVHTVRNALSDADSISIHIYRGNIAGTARQVFVNGLAKPFKSAYFSAALI
jgi:predicted metal-dependent enzyme (double-stranded beta helix superfamily)